MLSTQLNRSIYAVLFLLVFALCPSTHATEYYAFRLSGSGCTLCHTDPKTGELNEKGMRFQEEGYRYPFTWMQGIYYFLWVEILLLISWGFYRRDKLWSAGRKEGK